jgi:hypothetical protein
MRNFGIVLLLGIISPALNGQKIIEKNIDYENQYIDVDIKFASGIEVKTWDKQTIYFKADITTKEGKYLELYELVVVEEDSRISIRSNAEPVFEKFWEDYEKEHPGKRGRYFSTDNEYEFNYVLHVPKNARFKVSSINGDLRSDLIEGDFTADLINGDIDIKEYAGNLDLRTINGEIDLRMINTSLLAETIHGNIYADEKLKFKTTDRHMGQKIQGNFDSGENSLRLNTINGNMYLRL